MIKQYIISRFNQGGAIAFSSASISRIFVYKKIGNCVKHSFRSGVLTNPRTTSSSQPTQFTVQQKSTQQILSPLKV